MAAASAYEDENLDHPEILDRDSLITILCNRSIPLDEIKELDKQKLVNLFYKFVAPLPQRLHQLRRGKREPPTSDERIVGETTANLIQGRKRLSDVQNPITSVKIPKSDLEHVLINNGPSKLKVRTQETDLSANSNLKEQRMSQEVKAKPVKLNRKFFNLKLSSPSGNSTSELMCDRKEESRTEEKDRHHAMEAADYNKDVAAPLPSTHQILMICELKNVKPRVIYIDAHQKNMGSFLTFITSGKLPALIYGNAEPYVVIDDPEDIVEFLEKTYPDPPLECHSQSALNIQRRNFLSAFRKMMTNHGEGGKLLEELERLNIKLREKKTRFLDGDTIKLPDTYLLPVLHLIRVAGKVNNFKIPEKFTRVWEYIHAADEIPAFANHVPPDDLVIQHWRA